MSKGTSLQRLRCDPALWAEARAKLAEAGTNSSAAIRGFLAAVAEADTEQVAAILEQFPPKPPE